MTATTSLLVQQSQCGTLAEEEVLLVVTLSGDYYVFMREVWFSGRF